MIDSFGEDTRDYYIPVGRGDYFLLEISYEVCNQLGGIYTVIRSKVPNVAVDKRRYCLIGVYNPRTAPGEFEPLPLTGPVGRTVAKLRNDGFEAHYGTWLVPGKPRVVLLDPASVNQRLAEIKYILWKEFQVVTPADDPLIDGVLAFGFLVEQFIHAFVETAKTKRPIIAHFHEWMGGTALPVIRKQKLPVATVFTTHGTLLGRYLAIHDPGFSTLALCRLASRGAPVLHRAAGYAGTPDRRGRPHSHHGEFGHG